MSDFHCEIGEMIMNQWNLPDIYAVIARDHNGEKFDVQNSLLTIVRLVNKACQKMGIGFHYRPDLVLSASVEADILNLTGLDIAQLEIKLEDSFSLPT